MKDYSNQPGYWNQFVKKASPDRGAPKSSSKRSFDTWQNLDKRWHSSKSSNWFDDWESLAKIGKVIDKVSNKLQRTIYNAQRQNPCPDGTKGPSMQLHALAQIDYSIKFGVTIIVSHS